MPHPALQIIRIFIKNIDENPVWQNRIHTFGFWYWTVNFPLITWMFFEDKQDWSRYGLFITLIYSIYANWTSDFTGMSAAQGNIEVEVDEKFDLDSDIDTLES